VPALLTVSPAGGTDLVAADNLSGNALERPDADDPIAKLRTFFSVSPYSLPRPGHQGPHECSSSVRAWSIWSYAYVTIAAVVIASPLRASDS
jgi:hypothetical protein